MGDVSSGILPVLTVDRTAPAPLPRQIYDGFRTAILRGDLRRGQRVPSSRELAAALQISRFPVLDAYAQLLAEGYFEGRSGSGTYVSGSLPDQQTAPKPTAQKLAGSRQLARRSARIPRFEPTPWRHGWGAFGLHQPALDHFPFDLWSKLVARHSREPKLRAIHHIEPLGLDHFRAAVCDYLRTSRAVRCDPDQIMIVSGSQHALEITARVLLDERDAVWVEEPGYPLTRAVLTGSGCRVIPVPVDEEGMQVSAGIRLCRRARAAFVTPSHQYPMGVTMSASRRLQLLNWAQRSGAWIVEDDYDSEYRYENMTVPSLQGMDANARVIYIGTFSKVLFASLRLGYIVMPPDLVERFSTVRFAMDIFPSYLYQEVLADFMREGHFARHIRKMRSFYARRRSALVSALQTELGDRIAIHGAEAGMHLCVTLPDGSDDVALARKSAAERLWLWPLSTSYMRPPARHGFVLGYGSTPVAQIPQAIRQTRQVLGW